MFSAGTSVSGFSEEEEPEPNSSESGAAATAAAKSPTAAKAALVAAEAAAAAQAAASSRASGTFTTRTISDDHDGILDLPADAPLGARYAEWAHLDDPVIIYIARANIPRRDGVANNPIFALFQC